MKDDLTNRSLVREYLLGRLDEHAQAEERMSERILFNDDVAEIVDSVEDEILEEYLDGSLDSADRKAVETHFLQAPQRKEKLRFTQILRHHLQTKPLRSSVTTVENSVRPRVLWPAYLRTYGQFAALILIMAASLIYVTSIRRSRTGLQSELAQEQERSATLMRETEPSQPGMVSLTLVADRSRATGAQIPTVEIKSSTRRMVVDIGLQPAASGPYDVRLEMNGGERPLWSARLLPIISLEGDARLVFDVPTHDIQPEVYSFVVSSPSLSTGRTRHYDFRAKIAK